MPLVECPLCHKMFTDTGLTNPIPWHHCEYIVGAEFIINTDYDKVPSNLPNPGEIKDVQSAEGDMPLFGEGEG